MAEAIARDAVERGRIPGARDLFIASAGVHAADSAPVSSETITALRARGIEHRGSSKRLTAEMIRRADRVLAMTQSQAEAARRLVPGELAEQAKILALDVDGDVEDPIGLGQSAYDELAERLYELIPPRLAEILLRARSPGA